MTIAPINTQRLMLRPYYAGFVTPEHVAWLNDPEVVRYSEQRHKFHTLETTHAYVNDMACDPDSYLWGIDGKPEDSAAVPRTIGTISAHLDRHNGVANLGILIGDKFFWGNGYGHEAWDAVCNWLFDKRDIRKIEAGCHFENKAMRRLAESCGMHMESVVHDHFVVDGKPQHKLLYAKMKPASVRVSVDERGGPSDSVKSKTTA